jgi:hypothetical protein
MKLTLAAALCAIDQNLRERIAPALHADFAVQSARLASGLLAICAGAVDDAAEVRVAENAMLRTILSDVAPVLGGTLADQLDDAAKSRDPGLKISVLDRENHRLRLLLIAAQTQIETRQDGFACAMNQRIWRALEEIELRRAPVG